jgi:hypothetical protein
MHRLQRIVARSGSVRAAHHVHEEAVLRDAAALAEAHPHEHRAALDVLEGDARAEPPRQLRESWLLLRLSPITHASPSRRERALEHARTRRLAQVEAGAAVVGAAALLSSGLFVEEREVRLVLEVLDVELGRRAPRTLKGRRSSAARATR